MLIHHKNNISQALADLFPNLGLDHSQLFSAGMLTRRKRKKEKKKKRKEKKKNKKKKKEVNYCLDLLDLIYIQLPVNWRGKGGTCLNCMPQIINSTPSRLRTGIFNHEVVYWPLRYTPSPLPTLPFLPLPSPSSYPPSPLPHSLLPSSNFTALIRWLGSGRNSASTQGECGQDVAEFVPSNRFAKAQVQRIITHI